MDAPDADTADGAVLGGVGLLFEPTALVRRQRTTELHQDLAGNGRTLVDGDNLPRCPRVPLCRNRRDDQHSTRKQTEGNQFGSRHAVPSKLRRTDLWSVAWGRVSNSSAGWKASSSGRNRRFGREEVSPGAERCLSACDRLTLGVALETADSGQHA